MAKQRSDFQTVLESIPGVEKVYFQPPESVKLVYPCILYEYSRASHIYADNITYLFKKAYTVTVIDRDPDSEIPDKLKDFPMCTYDRTYIGDNLYHFVFTIFY